MTELHYVCRACGDHTCHFFPDKVAIDTPSRNWERRCIHDPRDDANWEVYRVDRNVRNSGPRDGLRIDDRWRCKACGKPYCVAFCTFEPCAHVCPMHDDFGTNWHKVIRHNESRDLVDEAQDGE